MNTQILMHRYKYIWPFAMNKINGSYTKVTPISTDICGTQITQIHPGTGIVNKNRPLQGK